MFTAKQYRAKAAEYIKLLKTASLPAETREFRKLEQSYLTLAENEEWMADNREKINRPGADENWYGDAILAQQGKHTLGCHGADVAMQPTVIPTKIQQLFDDAGSMGDLLQTATLRGPASSRARKCSARAYAADEAPGGPRSPGKRRPRARPPPLIEASEFQVARQGRPAAPPN
jgi:hypothetical protein